MIDTENLNDSKSVIECVEQGRDGLFFILKQLRGTAFDYESNRKTVSAMMAIEDTSNYSSRLDYTTNDISENFTEPQ